MVEIRTSEETAVKYGTSYFFAASNGALLSGESIDVCIDSKEDIDFCLRSIIIDSDSEMFSFQMYLNHVATEGTGTDLPLNSRNIATQNKTPLTAVQDSILTEQGDQLFPIARTIIGQAAPGNNSYMYQELLTGLYVIPKATSVLFRLTNISTSTVTVSVLMSGREFQ